MLSSHSLYTMIYVELYSVRERLFYLIVDALTSDEINNVNQVVKVVNISGLAK